MDLSNVAARLEAKFGLGTQPALRRELYLRLEQLVAQEGARAYMVIASTAADAARKQSPGRYFSHVVMLRLKERHILETVDL